MDGACEPRVAVPQSWFDGDDFFCVEDLLASAVLTQKYRIALGDA